MRIRTMTVALVTTVLSGGLTAVSAQTPDPAKVALGKKTFEDTKCATCHGEGGKSKDPALSLVEGPATKLSAADIRKWIVSPARNDRQAPEKAQSGHEEVRLDR